MPRDLPPTLRESRVTRAEALARTLESAIPTYLILGDFLESGLGDLEFPFIAPERVAVHRRLLSAIEHGGQADLDAALAEHAALSPLTSDMPP